MTGDNVNETGAASAITEQVSLAMEASVPQCEGGTTAAPTPALDPDMVELDEGDAASSGFAIHGLDMATRRLYSQFFVPGELVTVAAMTGGLKTVFELNMAAALMADGGTIAFVNLDMQKVKIYQRLFPILSGMPAKIAKDPSGFLQMQDLCHPLLKGFDFGDRKGLSFNTAELVGMVLSTIQQSSASLIIIDGFDKVMATSAARRIDMEHLLSCLSDIAANLNVCIVISSQVTRDANGLEALQLRHLAEASGKGDRSGMTIMLGQRIQGQLITLCLVKDRYCVRPDGQLVRLVLRDSLRLEVLPTSGIAPGKYAIPPAPEYQRVNALPGDFSDSAVRAGVESDSAFDTGNDPDAGETDGLVGSLMPFSVDNPEGYIMAKRSLALSPMYQNGDSDDVFHVMDLAFLAHIVARSVYAPKTRILVHMNRGQYMVTHSGLAKRWQVSEQKVKRLLKTAASQGLLLVENAYPDGTRKNAFAPSNVPTNGPGMKAICTVVTVKFIAAEQEKPSTDNHKKRTEKRTIKGTDSESIPDRYRTDGDPLQDKGNKGE